MSDDILIIYITIELTPFEELNSVLYHSLKRLILRTQKTRATSGTKSVTKVRNWNGKSLLRDYCSPKMLSLLNLDMELTITNLNRTQAQRFAVIQIRT